MKKKILLLLFLIFLFIVFVYFKDVAFKNAEGRLKISSSPVASVFLNSEAIGAVPFDQKVKEGEYMLKLIPEGTATDTATWQGKIKIYKNSLTFVDRELGKSDLNSAGVILTITKMTEKPETPNTGEIEVQTDPTGAIIYLDNDEKGIAPLKLSQVLRGEHELSVYSPGFFRRTQKINVETDFRDVAQFKLAVDPSHKKISDIKKEKTGSPEAKIKKTFVVIKNTETGFLRVRSGPSLSASEAARVKPSQKFEFLEEASGWFKIYYEKDKEGWVLGSYAQKVEE